MFFFSVKILLIMWIYNSVFFTDASGPKYCTSCGRSYVECMGFEIIHVFVLAVLSDV